MRLTPECPLCAAAIIPTIHVKAAIGGAPMSIGECQRCRLALQTPQPTREESAAYMDGRWSSTAADDSYVNNPARKLAQARRLVDWLDTLDLPSRRVLDVGAGNGAFVAAAREKGWDATGTELSRAAVVRAKDYYGVDLVHGDIDSTPASPEYALVTLWDVIEHLRNPVEMLRAVHARTASGGIVVVETGNYESAHRLISGDRWGLYLFDHMFYFTPASLASMMDRAGFREFRLHQPGKQSRKPGALTVLKRLRRAPRTIRGIKGLREARRRWPEHWNLGVLVASGVKQA